MMRPVFVLALALLAGCAAPIDPPPDAPTAPTTPTREPHAFTPASAGAVTPPARQNGTIPVSAEGRTEGEACPGGLGQERCQVWRAAEGSPVLLPRVERPTLIELSIEVAEPIHAPGCGWVVLRLRDGEGWRSLGSEGMFAMGSPMEIAWSLADQPPSAELHLAVYCGSDTHVGEGAITFYRGWDVPFRVEGRVFHET